MRPSRLFISLSILCLALGILFGITGVLQYLYPEFLKSSLSFEKVRPLHVTLVVSFIVLCASGIVYRAIENDGKWESRFLLGKIHFALFTLTGICILGSYLMGKFGGREYMEFTPWLFMPILLGWVLMAVNYFTNFIPKFRDWHVYHWMWATGLVFMILTLSEAQLWLFDYYRSNVVREVTVQWKSYGAMVGSWNMLIYGSGIYVMNQIHFQEKSVKGFMPFALYFLGFTNLLFGWAHHTYIVPSAPWVRHIAYSVSMTELLIVAKLIIQWRKSFLPVRELMHLPGYRLLWSADIWVFINLVLAMVISVPAINYYTHGTHFTVAHSMGTTIGINTNILLAAVFLIFTKTDSAAASNPSRILPTFISVFQASLVVFWVNLLWMGYKRSLWMYADPPRAFSQLHDSLFTNHLVFLAAGIGIFVSILAIVFFLLRQLLKT